MPKATRKKFTVLGLDREAAPKDRPRKEIWDTLVPGFGLRISKSNVRTFQVMYRLDGRSRRKDIGRYLPGDPECLAKARKRAHEIKELAASGVDPEVVERERAAEQARARANTFAAARVEFVERYAKPKNRSWREAESYLKRDLAAWDDRPIGSITRRDVIAAISRKANTSGPVAGNRLLAYTRKFFNWCVGQDLIDVSPVQNIERPGAEKARERALDESEIKTLWDAWAKLGWPWTPMLRLLLVTGQRRNEVAHMRWSEIRPRPLPPTDPNVTPIEWEWVIPASRTKGKREHTVPLTPLAMSIIANLPRHLSPFVFPARGNSNHGVSGFSHMLDRCHDLAGFDDWTIHDLRRTCGTGLARLGIPVSTISRVLNHAEGGVTKIYNRHAYGDEKRRALETWAAALSRIVGPAVPSNVVQLVAAR